MHETPSGPFRFVFTKLAHLHSVSTRGTRRGVGVRCLVCRLTAGRNPILYVVQIIAR